MNDLLPVVDVELCAERLERVFPRGAFDAALSNPGAAASVAAMIYVGAVFDQDAAEQRWLRPSMVMWMSDSDLAHTSTAEREEWYAAARRGKKRVQAVLEARGEPWAPRYGDNTREGPRDDTWPQWREFGAVVYRTDVASTYPGPRWSLARDFAELFNPSLDGDALVAGVDKWHTTHLSKAGRMKSLRAQEVARSEHAVNVLLPSGEHRLLEPGGASLILKGVIEEWAARKLLEPLVLSISEPGDKVPYVDGPRLARIGLNIDPSRVLPDALIVDVGTEPIQFWMIEAVFSDGEVNERRKLALLEWAREQGIDPDECHFLTAFTSRNSGPARKRLKDLAEGTSAWFLAEPELELTWSRIARSEPVVLAPVTPLRRRD